MPELGPEVEDRLAALLVGLYADERSGRAEKAEVRIGPFTAYLAIGALQLAWRHPHMSASNRKAIEDLGRQLQVLFGGELAESLERGWDVCFDQPVSQW